ncbi:hypothetical protein MKK70_00905 [Methylobacterium sp. E-041]|uniref:hypothetical protein n=1 Tax=unclassified Methylobacterium TaxID=2615210 RepID=UPI0011CA3B9B|nr:MULTISPECIES: hypothetical protein [unclassified Methylobacterium]MCJ2007262.1 hypothetical protein [Methylobacterium sp. J-092]MCJ2074364.1 hypothetical protein [Methylobacterium sp. E-016]MCJ2103965.1 hypothetical protein [Methylobacterium sp. E-041]MCJ2112701.1 hypothetical protein [Methylobacterium sp. E-025]TXM93321.1 hypothetical protein FV223_08740 [Methylobacterium sp. WL116]
MSLQNQQNEAIMREIALPSMPVYVGLCLMILGMEAEHLACRRWRMAQHSKELDIRVVLGFSLPLAGFLLMWLGRA